MKRKTQKAIGSALAAWMLLTGCQSQTAGPDNNKTDEAVSITVWTYYNGEQLSSFNDLVDEFNNTVGAEKGITVISSSQGTVNDLETNVLNAAQGKVGADEVPNIFAAYADTAYTIDRMGLAVDLSEFFSEEELDAYIGDYISEGQFSGGDTIKIFPTAKSTEVFLLNKTDWEPFASECGFDYEDLSTMEGVLAVSQAYYEWTDAKTPAPDDGKAFFGRDAVANYFLIGSMQLGTELFHVEDGKMTLDFNKETLRTLWDHYYVPLVKGYFAATGRFRSDDVKTGNILSFVGSSSGATFFPDNVILGDTDSHPIEMLTLPCPQFKGGDRYAVQQGAGMVVTTGTDRQVEASVEFLKWFTDPERNISFSVNSGYLPVTKKANDIDAIRDSKAKIDPVLEGVLEVAVETVNSNTLYTPKAFSDGTSARAILEHSMTDLALADRETVKTRIQEGQSMEDAAAEFLTDEYFDSWYEQTLKQLQAYEG